VPLDKIPLLAKALGVDPAHMFRLALEQYWLFEAAAGHRHDARLFVRRIDLIARRRPITP
jgi:hypothetical protein